MAHVSHSECAGQAQLVRDLKASLDACLESCLCGPSLEGPVSIGRVKELSLRLACELEVFEGMCRRCEAEGEA